MIDGGENYEHIDTIGCGNFGVCQLMLDKSDGERVAVKFLARGRQIDKHVEREIHMHSQLQHPNVVGFKRVFLTPTHLGIVLEYAAGGELFERVRSAGHFAEDEARYFFQQLVCGVQYCHTRDVAHRDLKLENTLLDDSPAPLLKICDFGFCKDMSANTPPKTTVGTPAYISPEVLAGQKTYDGKAADVWSCGVHLYVMLVGVYPFDDPRKPGHAPTTIENIERAEFAWPRNLAISPACKELVNRMLVADARKRIRMEDLRQHAWFLKNLPDELRAGGFGLPCYTRCTQPVEEIAFVLSEGKQSPGYE